MERHMISLIQSVRHKAMLTIFDGIIKHHLVQEFLNVLDKDNTSQKDCYDTTKADGFHIMQSSQASKIGKPGLREE